MNNKNIKLSVMGGGPGGYAAAFLAADMGMDVTLIDPEINPGGVCLYRGCIPTKALLQIAKIMGEVEIAESMGISFGKPQINLEQVRKWKDQVVQKLTQGLGQLNKQRKINYIQGKAFIIDNQTLEIITDSGKKQKLNFNKLIIATGSIPRSIPGLDFSERVMDSTIALKLSDIPKRLLVIGAGYIGLELGTIYARLGSEVTIAEMLDDILPMADKDIIAEFKKEAKKIIHEFKLNTLAEAKEEKKGVNVKFKNINNKDKILDEQTYDKILVTIGRIPQTKGIGIENTKVTLDEKDFIRVNKQRQTSESSIYAIGDVVGDPLLAHKATHEGRVAVESIAGQKSIFDPHAIPAVEYTDPEIAWCGLTEKEAKEKNIEIKISKFPWAASGRAATMGRKYGLTKLIIDPKTDRILGAGIVGKDAGELISEVTLAIEMAALASDLELTIHPHPTLSETIMEAAEVYYGTSTDIYRPLKK